MMSSYLSEENILTEALWTKVQKEGVESIGCEHETLQLFLKSVDAYTKNNYRRALNMGLRFQKSQSVLPEGYIQLLCSAASELDRLEELFDIFMLYSYRCIDEGDFNRGLNYMRVAFNFPKAGKHIYDEDKMQEVSSKLSVIAECLNKEYIFRVPEPSLNRKVRLAIVTSLLVDDVQAWSKTSMQFARYFDREKYELKLYYMDPGHPDRPGDYLLKFKGGISENAGSKSIKELQELGVSYAFCPPVKFTDGAVWLADDLARECIDSVLFQGSVNTNMMWLASALSSVPVKMQLCLGLNMYQKGIDATIYMNNANLEKEKSFWTNEWGVQKFIGGGADIEEAKRTIAPDRSEIDVPEDAITFGMLSMFVKERVTEEFMDCVVAILLECPNAYFVCMGSEDVIEKVEYMNSRGVGERCRWLGLQTKPFWALKFLDFYLNEIPRGSSQSIRECMCCGIPALAMKYSEDHHESVGADIVGEEYAVMENNSQEYIRRAIGWIKNPESRKSAAKDLFERAKKHYSAEKFVEEMTDYMASFLK